MNKKDFFGLGIASLVLTVCSVSLYNDSGEVTLIILSVVTFLIGSCLIILGIKKSGKSKKTENADQNIVVEESNPKTEPPKTEPPKTEPPKTELPKTEPQKTEPQKTEPQNDRIENVTRKEQPKEQPKLISRFMVFEF